MSPVVVTEGVDIAPDNVAGTVEPYAPEAAPEATVRRAAVPMRVPLRQVHASPSNPRKIITLDEIEALGASLQQHGQLTRVLLRPMATPKGADPSVQHYELAAGHRRSLAALHLGWTDIDADVREMDDHSFLMVLWAENLQRADVPPMDEAIGIRDLQAAGWDLAAIAAEIGRPEAYVRGRLALLQLSPAAQQSMHVGLLPVTHAQELAKLPSAVQDDVLREVFNLSPVKLTDVDAAPEIEEDLPPDEDLAAVFTEDNPHGYLAEETWKPVRVPTLEDLRADLKARFYRRLSVVSWPLDDSTLLKGAGACTTCEKRSGHAPTLFPELVNARGEACLDVACFRAKEKAFARRIEQQQLAATLPEGAPMPSKKELKAREAEARAAEKARSEQESAKAQAQREQRYQIKSRARIAGVRAVLAEVTPAGLHSVPLLRALLHLIIDCTKVFEGPKDIVLLEVLGLALPAPLTANWHWQAEEVRTWVDDPTRTERHLVRALVLMVLATSGDVRVSDYFADRQYPALLQLAEVMGVNIVDIMAATERETKEQLVAAAKAEKQATKAAAKKPKRKAQPASSEDDTVAAVA